MTEQPSQKTKTPAVSGLGTSNKVPYAAELEETADLIADNTLTSLRSGKVTGVEASGQFSLALLLKRISTGEMNLGDAYSFLKTLADKKTPNPAQQVEQHQVIDLQAMIGVAVSKNPTALEDTVALAIASRQQIREKLDLPDASLTLEPVKGSVAGARPELQTLTPVQPTTILPSANIDSTILQGDSGEAVPGSAGSFAPGPHEPLAPPESLTLTLRDMDWKPGDPPPEVKKLDNKRR